MTQMDMPPPVRRFHELAEVGKVAVGAGVGGLMGWVATMASVTGSGGHFKVWTVWSVLLVVLSGVAVVGGAVLWWLFRKPPPETPVIHVHSGGVVNYNSVPQPPRIVEASTSDTVTFTTSPGFRLPPQRKGPLKIRANANPPPLFDPNQPKLPFGEAEEESP